MASNQANAAGGSPPHTNLAAGHLQAAKEAQKESIRENMKAKPAYKGCYNRFTKYVDQQRLQRRLNITDKYLERDAIDLFFYEYFKGSSLVPLSVTRYKYALQWYADNDEHIHAGFIVDSPSVAKSIQMYAVTYKEKNRSVTGRDRTNIVGPNEDMNAPLSDPFGHLPTNVVAWADTKRAIFFIFANRLCDWFSLLLIWTWSIAASLRNISIRSICFSDVLVDTSHGAERSGPLSRSINVVLRKGTGKGSFTEDRVVAAWRGKEWWHCPIGQLAFSLVFRLNNFASEMSFYNRDRTKDKFWRNMLFIAKDTYNDCYKGIKAVMDACGILSNKVTHFGRVWGIDFASFLGLREEQMRRQTKHEDSQMSRVYSSELDAGMLKTMANFLPDETYYCPRATIGTPLPVADLSHLLFPHLASWRFQEAHIYGDKGGKHFLYELLPYLAEVCVQDGIYLIEAFPNHAVSQLLIARIPRYEIWAREKRAEIANMVSNYDEDAMKNLSLATQSVVNSGVRRHEELGSHSRSYFKDSTAREVEVCQSVLRIERQNEHIISQNDAILRAVRANQNQATGTGTEPTGRPATPRRPVPAAPVPAYNNAGTAGAPPAPPPRPPPLRQGQVNPLNRLAPNGRHPLCGLLGNLPSSIRSVLESFLLNGMNAFEHASSRRSLTDAENLAYSKRKYLYDTIVKRASSLRREMATESFDVRKYRAADSMDQERARMVGKVTVDGYRKWLKKNDPDCKKRKRTSTQTQQV